MREDENIPRMSRTAEFGREQERSLRRMKLFATGLLALMAVTYSVCRLFESSYPLLKFVAAFSEAGTIGALADWFAVVALFRHPLNLPIPRTAVIPRNRDRIGESLARFIKENFLAKDLLEKRMADVDFAALVAAWISDEKNARFLARTAAEYLPSLLPERADETDRTDGPKKRLSASLSGMAEAVWARPLVRKAAARVLSGLDRLGVPVYGKAAARLGEALSGGEGESRQGRPDFGPVWKILKERLIRDLGRPDSDLVRQAADFIRQAGQGAFTDRETKDRINRALSAWISEAVDENKELFALFISETVKKWDPEATSRRIELHVGKDLQWIRINGTIVGGLAGLLIYFLSVILGGR